MGYTTINDINVLGKKTFTRSMLKSTSFIYNTYNNNTDIVFVFVLCAAGVGVGLVWGVSY